MGKWADRRHERKLKRIEARTTRRNRKQERKESKYQSKVDKVESRTDRTFLRQEPKIAAVNAGIDPWASKWSGLSSITGSIAGIFGGGEGTMNSNIGGLGKDNMLLIGAVALIAMFVLKK